MAFGHFLLGSHNSMVAALGLCVKWPLVCHAKLEIKYDGPLINLMDISPCMWAPHKYYYGG